MPDTIDCSPATSRTLGVLLPRCRSLMFRESAPARVSAQALGIQAGLGFLGSRGVPRAPRKIEALLTHGDMRRNNGKTRGVALLARPPRRPREGGDPYPQSMQNLHRW